MERRFPWPNEVRGVGNRKPCVARFGEAQTKLSTFAVAQVDGRRWHEIEVMDVEAQNAKQPRQTREIAVDHALEIVNAPVSPVPHMLASKQLHANENIDRRHDLAGLEDGRHRALDPWEQRVATKCRDRYRWFSPPCHAAMIIRSRACARHKHFLPAVAGGNGWRKDINVFLDTHLHERGFTVKLPTVILVQFADRCEAFGPGHRIQDPQLSPS